MRLATTSTGSQGDNSAEREVHNPLWERQREKDTYGKEYKAEGQRTGNAAGQPVKFFVAIHIQKHSHSLILHPERALRQCSARQTAQAGGAS
jgi:hypothetical protein